MLRHLNVSKKPVPCPEIGSPSSLPEILAVPFICTKLRGVREFTVTSPVSDPPPRIP